MSGLLHRIAAQLSIISLGYLMLGMELSEFLKFSSVVGYSSPRSYVMGPLLRQAPAGQTTPTEPPRAPQKTVRHVGDYQFKLELNMYFKLHLAPQTWAKAWRRCYLEGAIIATPHDTYIKKVMSSLMAEKNVYQLFTGIGEVLQKGVLLSAEGYDLWNFTYESRIITWHPGEPSNKGNASDLKCIVMYKNEVLGEQPCSKTFPYICYRKHTPTTVYYPECGTTDIDYKLSPEPTSCYKFQCEAKTWRQAIAVCEGDSGHLAVINNDTEAKHLSDLFTQNYDKIKLHGYKDTLLLGFHDEFLHGNWLTLHGQTLKEAGYEAWSGGEPNSPRTKHCGGMLKDGKLNDAPCNMPLPFVCELPAPPKSARRRLFGNDNTKRTRMPPFKINRRREKGRKRAKKMRLL